MEATYFILLYLFIILWWAHSRDKKQMALMIQRKMAERKIIKNSKGDEMKELVKKFIGKDCIINTFNSQLDGRLLEVSEDGGAILIERMDKQVEAVNLDYVIRLREYPTKKNGKRKDIVLD